MNAGCNFFILLQRNERSGFAFYAMRNIMASTQAEGVAALMTGG